MSGIFLLTYVMMNISLLFVNIQGNAFFLALIFFLFLFLFPFFHTVKIFVLNLLINSKIGEFEEHMVRNIITCPTTTTTITTTDQQQFVQSKAQTVAEAKNYRKFLVKIWLVTSSIILNY